MPDLMWEHPDEDEYVLAADCDHYVAHHPDLSTFGDWLAVANCEHIGWFDTLEEAQEAVEKAYRKAEPDAWEAAKVTFDAAVVTFEKEAASLGVQMSSLATYLRLHADDLAEKYGEDAP